jgi:hypothetical protein
MPRLAPMLAVGVLCALPGTASAEAGPTLPKLTPANTAAPTLTGTPLVGQALTCSPGSWTNDPNGFAYAWLSNGAPIAGQTGNTYVIQAGDMGKSISCEVTASVLGGEYTITGLRSASYKVFFEAYASVNGNLLSQSFSGKTIAEEPTPVPVTAPSLTPSIDAALQTGGEIAGKVLDASAMPLADVTVCADEPTADLGECAETNTSGEYVIIGLQAGSYNVSFLGEQCSETECVYYEASELEAVAVTPPNVTGGIDATAQRITTGAVEGTVEGAGPKPLEGIEVCVSSYEFYGCGTTNASGKYKVPSVPDGTEYTVYFSPPESSEYVAQYYNKTLHGEDAAHVSVTGSSSTKVNASLERGGGVKGAVETVTGSPIANVTVCAYEETLQFNAGCVVTRENGEYTLLGLPAGTKYEVYFEPPLHGSYLDLYDTSVSVTAGAVNALGVVHLAEGGRISGTVTNAAGGALANAEVCVTGAFRCAYANANGEYTIVGINGGSHTVEFTGYQCSPEGESQNCVHEYLGEEVDDVEVHLPGTTEGVDAALAEGGKISGKVTSTTGAMAPGVHVCAISIAEHPERECAYTGEVGGSASATSNALAIAAPNSHFKLKKKPSFDAKSGNLVFVFEFPEAGSLEWALSFENSDVAFADDLAISGGEAFADAAKKHGKGKSEHCKKGFVKHNGKCVHSTVLFGKGSTKVAAGAVTLKVHASSKALKALKSGHKLHVGGAFTFQPALGGMPATMDVKALVSETKKHEKKAKKHKRKKG